MVAPLTQSMRRTSGFDPGRAWRSETVGASDAACLELMLERVKKSERRKRAKRFEDETGWNTVCSDSRPTLATVLVGRWSKGGETARFRGCTKETVHGGSPELTPAVAGAARTLLFVPPMFWKTCIESPDFGALRTSFSN